MTDFCSRTSRGPDVFKLCCNRQIIFDTLPPLRESLS